MCIHSTSRTSICETNVVPESAHRAPGISQDDQDYAFRVCQLPARADCGVDDLKVANSTRRGKSCSLTWLLSRLVDRIPADSTCLPLIESIQPRHVFVVECEVENLRIRMNPSRRGRFREGNKSVKIVSTMQHGQSVGILDLPFLQRPTEHNLCRFTLIL